MSKIKDIINKIRGVTELSGSVQEEILGALDGIADSVSNTGDESIAGVKTFTGSAVVDGKQVSTGQRKNYLINGNFDMWQYGTSQTTSGYGSDDRWNNANNVSTKTHSRVACTDTERVLFNATYFSRTVSNYVAGTNSFVVKLQMIENITLLAGKTVTVSFWAKADSNKKMNVSLTDFYGTGGTPTAAGTQFYSLGNIDLTTTWTKYKLTTTVPSIVGKTLGTDGVHTSAWKLQVGITYSADRNEVSLYGMPVGQSGTFDIAQVKLEDGSVATDGWHPYDGEFGGEIQACQRYYETGADSWGGTCSRFVGNVSSGIPYDSTTKFKVTKRTTPTVVLSNIYAEGFQSTVGAVNASIGGFAEGRVASSSISAGTFVSGFTASAEL